MASEVDIARSLGEEALNDLFQNRIIDSVDKPTITPKDLKQREPYEIDPDRKELVLNRKDLLGAYLRISRELEKAEAARNYSRKSELESALGVYRRHLFNDIRRGAISFARSKIVPETTNPYARRAEEGLQYFIISLLEEISGDRENHKVHLGIATIYARKQGVEPKDERQARIYGISQGITAALSKRSVEEKIRIAQELMKTADYTVISKKLSYLAKEGIQTAYSEVKRYGIKVSQPKSTEVVGIPTKKTLVISFLILMGTLFLFPQLPNQVTASIVLLPTANLLFINFLVALLIILLIYTFSTEVF